MSITSSIQTRDYFTVVDLWPVYMDVGDPS